MSSRLRVCLAVLAVAALLFSAAALAARSQSLSNVIELIFAVASPFTPILAILGLGFALLGRRLLLSLLAAAVIVITLAIQVPWYYFWSPTGPGPHAEIRVLSSNLRKGQAEPSSFVELAREYADVIVAPELTPEEVRHFSQAGIEEDFPYAALSPAPGAGGMGLWSRFPLVRLSPGKQRNTTVIAARLRVPGTRFDPLVAGVHVISPVTAEADSFSRWQSGISGIKATLNNLTEKAGPAAVIVAGDFNSTPDMRQFRDLLTDGYRDAVEQTGAGFAPTFPSNKWFPPVLVIDHILTRNAAASSIRTVNIPGSDHRALLATIKMPLDPTAS
ncbi:endonuclease/exonuclease/phosphatase family protein [Mycolicibacterium sp. XJ879]